MDIFLWKFKPGSLSKQRTRQPIIDSTALVTVPLWLIWSEVLQFTERDLQGDIGELKFNIFDLTVNTSY